MSGGVGSVGGPGNDADGPGAGAPPAPPPTPTHPPTSFPSRASPPLVVAKAADFQLRCCSKCSPAPPLRRSIRARPIARPLPRPPGPTCPACARRRLLQLCARQRAPGLAQPARPRPAPPRAPPLCARPRPPARQCATSPPQVAHSPGPQVPRPPAQPGPGGGRLSLPPLCARSSPPGPARPRAARPPPPPALRAPAPAHPPVWSVATLAAARTTNRTGPIRPCPCPALCWRVRSLLRHSHLKGEIHFYPRPVLKNNKGDQDMTRAYQQHRNMPPNCSVGRSIQTRVRRSPPGIQTKDTVDF
jgi:hypothetical protein